MKAPLDFYFDFSSPYGYLAAEKIGPLAARHGRTVTWRPMLLGVAFKATGGAPLPTIPLNVNIAEADNVLRIAASVGCKPDLNKQAVKDKTRAEVDSAQPFWGIDRFDQLERWLREPF